MTDVLDDLRHANPVDADALEVSPELTARVVGRSSARPRRTRRLRLAVAVLATAAATFLAVLLAPGERGPERSLAARAYAATTGEGIIHWRIERHSYSNGHHIDHQRVEGWARKGVTHSVRYTVRRGKARLTDDNRTTPKRSRTYIAASDDYISVPVSSSRTMANPLAGGDPFAIFRRAYRTGKLRKLGPQHYAVELPGNPKGASAIYDLDARTALPRSFTLTDSNVSLGKRYDNKLVMRFEVYERLPFTATNRARLRLLPHPGAGPKDDPAAEHFAVLRGDRRPRPGAVRAIRGFAGQVSQFALDAGGARVIAPGRYLIPGHGYICLGSSAGRGFGGGCVTIAQAVKHGIASGLPASGITVAVPDGVTALRARKRGGGSETVAVRRNYVKLPVGAYAWQFVR